MSSGKIIGNYEAHDSPVLTLRFNPYDLTLASGSADKTIKYWDVEHNQLVKMSSFGA